MGPAHPWKPNQATQLAVAEWQRPSPNMPVGASPCLLLAALPEVHTAGAARVEGGHRWWGNTMCWMEKYTSALFDTHNSPRRSWATGSYKQTHRISLCPKVRLGSSVQASSLESPNFGAVGYDGEKVLEILHFHSCFQAVSNTNCFRTTG